MTSHVAPKGTCLFPTTQGEDQSGAANGLVLNWSTPAELLRGWASKELLNWFLWFPQRLFLRNACHLALHPPSPSLSEAPPLWVFLFVLPRQTVAWGMLCVGSQPLLVFPSLRCLQSNPHISNLSFPLLSLLAPSPPQENQGKLTSSRTGEIELYYFSFGNFTLLPLSASYHFLHLLARVLIDRWPLNAYADQ